MPNFDEALGDVLKQAPSWSLRAAKKSDLPAGRALGHDYGELKELKRDPCVATA